jgi:C-terminal processing protease CtpA/Prc
VFWEEALAYDALQSDSEKEQMIRSMYDKYLSDDAVVELNLPDKQRMLAPVLQAVNDYRDNATPIPKNILHDIITNCRKDLMDPFTRFVETSVYKQIETSINSEKKQVEVMMQIGMVQSAEDQYQETD